MVFEVSCCNKFRRVWDGLGLRYLGFIGNLYITSITLLQTYNPYVIL